MPRVFFYCTNEPGNMQEDVIALAEGFLELGIPFHANCDYWLQSTTPGDYLFRHDPDVTPDDCDVVVVSCTWPHWVRMKTFDLRKQPLPAGIFKQGRKYTTVYMDFHDGYKTVSWEPEFRQFDLILRTKYNRRAFHPENMRAWTYGLNNRIVKATAGGAPFPSRRRVALTNFNASHPYQHGARSMAQKLLEPALSKVLPIDNTKDDLSLEPSDPYEALMWHQTGGRFSRSYYERLKSCQAVLTFCGEIIPPAPFQDPERYLVGGNRAKLLRAWYTLLGFFDPRQDRSIHWDSFRFWESLSAGCATINVDLEDYGVVLPVMPVNGKHYLGLDFARVDEFVERIRDEPGILQNVAAEGKSWSEQHYSPSATAKRFLDMVLQ